MCLGFMVKALWPVNDTGLLGCPMTQQDRMGRFQACSGKARCRLPVSANSALPTAGAIGGTAGSPTPAGWLLLATMWVSTCASMEPKDLCRAMSRAHHAVGGLASPLCRPPAAATRRSEATKP